MFGVSEQNNFCPLPANQKEASEILFSGMIEIFNDDYTATPSDETCKNTLDFSQRIG